MDPTVREQESAFAFESPSRTSVFSKLERCVSPASQAKTATLTPNCFSELPGSVFSRTTSAHSNASGNSAKGSEEAEVEDLLGLLAVPMGVPEESSKKCDAECLVDNSKLKAQTVGLAFRFSKRVQDRDHTVPGLAWGTTVVGVDEGDGWLKVGERFLPMSLDGAPVLTVPGCNAAGPWPAASWDGPALTAEGRAVDLDGGAMLFFAYAKELSHGYEAKCRAKEEARRRRAARLASTAREAAACLEAGEACSIDSSGVVRGAAALGPPPPQGGDKAAGAARRHLHHRRQLHRNGAGGGGVGEAPVLCVDGAGKVSLYLHFPRKQDGVRHLRSRGTASREDEGVLAVGLVLIIDAEGTVRGCRRADAPPPVVPAPGGVGGQ